jgi:DedD protein
MDRRVKERLIGAAILTVLVVLVVPELLSGPSREAALPSQAPAGPDPAVRTVTVDLATRKTTALTDSSSGPTAVPVSVPPLARESEAAESTDHSGEAARAPAAMAPPTVATLKAQPAYAAVENSPAGPNSAKSGGQSMPKPSAADFRAVTAIPRVPVTAPSAEIVAPPGRWAVQLGSFSSRVNAEKVAREVQSRDASVYVTTSGSGEKMRYRVRVGPLPDRAAAEKTLARLRKDGLAASLVPP